MNYNHSSYTTYHNDDGYADAMYDTYEKYMKAVDKILLGAIGLTHMDIADSMWYDAFENSTPPEEAAKEALINEDGFPIDLIDELF